MTDMTAEQAFTPIDIVENWALELFSMCRITGADASTIGIELDILKKAISGPRIDEDEKRYQELLSSLDKAKTLSLEIVNGVLNKALSQRVPDGWSVRHGDNGAIIVQKDGIGGYVASQEGYSGIAESILYHLAADMLTAAPAPADELATLRERVKALEDAVSAAVNQSEECSMDDGIVHAIPAQEFDDLVEVLDGIEAAHLRGGSDE